MIKLKGVEYRNLPEQASYNACKIDKLDSKVEELKQQGPSDVEFNVEIPDSEEPEKLNTIKEGDKYYKIEYDEPTPPGPGPSDVDITLFQVTAYSDGPAIDFESGFNDIVYTEMDGQLREELMNILNTCLNEDAEINITFKRGIDENDNYTFLINQDINTLEVYNDISQKDNYFEMRTFNGHAYAEYNGADGTYLLHVNMDIDIGDEEGEDIQYLECLFENPEDTETIYLKEYTLGW